MGSTSPPIDADAGFHSLYDAEIVRQVRSATLLLGSRAAAQDVVHDAFVNVWRRWGTLADPGPYLQRAVLNGCRDVQRRGRVADRHLPRLVAPGDVPEPDVGLYDALAALPFNHRAAIVLRFYLQLTEAEIAERLGCRPGSVGPWIRRGLNRLATDLDPRGG